MKATCREDTPSSNFAPAACSRLAPFVRLFIVGYRLRPLRPLIRCLLNRFDGGYMWSQVWREIFRKHLGVELGPCSRGLGLRPGTLPRGTIVGSFSCLARGLIVLRRNHTTQRLSQHPLFFNKILGLVPADTIGNISENPLQIGSDVWLGMNVTICPGCHVIGDGAIIGAQAVVTRDVPPYSIVAGNPARIIRKRFSPEVETVVSASRWWEYPFLYIMEHVELFSGDIDEQKLHEFTLAFPPGENTE